MDVQALRAARLALRERIDRHPWIEYLGATLLLSLLTLLAHGASLQGSWRWDDGAHLSYAAQHTPWQYFLEPHIAQGHSSANVAPWNLLFYDINLSLFGMAAAGHYAHLLLLVGLGAALFYAVLREWVAPLPALIGAIALLLGKPTAHIAAGLMHGHYASGFVFAMLSILGWTRYLKGGRGYWLALSALAYLLATTCKEVYVPLVVLLPFLPVGTLRQRMRALVPFVLIALAYMGWRYLLLGRLVGGYSQGVFDAGEALRQLLRVPKLLLGSKPPGNILAVVFLGLLCLAVVKRRLHGPVLFVSLGIVLLPLIPLTAFPGIHSPDRYLFVPWIAFSACLAAIWPREARPAAALVGSAALVAALAGVHAQETQALRPNLAYWDTLYRFALSLDKERQAIFVVPEFGGTDDGYKRSVLIRARNTADLFAPKPQPGNLHVVDEKGRGLEQIPSTTLQLFEFRDGDMVPMSAERVAEKFPSLTRGKTAPSTG
ncbi:hypothetical protein ASE52_10450 [Acidovorax sp. Root275]|nr:hypothetical protein ASE52_10450 [Acidovorax sp. Root275]